MRQQYALGLDFPRNGRHSVASDFPRHYAPTQYSRRSKKLTFTSMG
ncbi:hypothetical protein SAMN05216308_101676 [Nitrosospira sp. Nsp13]|nr:hypothetical protein SAMN05216308_101676 [Nitrosospira sp. Nsp13]